MGRTLGAAFAAVVTAAAVVLMPVTAHAATPPATPPFNRAIDGYAANDPVTSCDAGIKPGLQDFRSFIKNRYGLGNTIDFVVGCDLSGPGGHDQGRAWDWGNDVGDPADVDKVDTVLGWLLDTDVYGNRHAMARRLGINFIIWNRRIIFLTPGGAKTWEPYSCNGSASSCHTNHVHFEMSWAGARRQTTWWTARQPDHPGVFRPGPNDWFFRGSGTMADWGQPGDLPVAGDWDRDGIDEPGVFRPSERRWYLHGNGTVDGWGEPGDLPVAGDWNGDGIDEPGVFRPSERRWYLRGAGTVDGWGEPGDRPVAGDWDGDGVDEPGVFRPGTLSWHLRGRGGVANWGLADDQPVAGDWDGDGVDEPGVRRPGTKEWYFRTRPKVTEWGEPGDLAVAGNWS
ncbi:hypothetical protein [Virgisporangium aurantiacum]|uniref:ARB-07466-like C-terminal domain-containing protein n=1 Tax=Virgisporangium aurantiacum TaxID=175570 RepID=A0A8J3ZMD0_9ACTN|nr:hypothetical protein [Virgisporangium aurantiacum]GIJ64055.1 hypothetical protein Vau01_115710 [Virgisporangium aurantiacum]